MRSHGLREFQKNFCFLSGYSIKCFTGNRRFVFVLIPIQILTVGAVINIQTSRSTSAKYALTGVLIKGYSSICANF